MEQTYTITVNTFENGAQFEFSIDRCSEQTVKQFKEDLSRSLVNYEPIFITFDKELVALPWDIVRRSTFKVLITPNELPE